MEIIKAPIRGARQITTREEVEEAKAPTLGALQITVQEEVVVGVVGEVEEGEEVVAEAQVHGVLQVMVAVVEEFSAFHAEAHTTRTRVRIVDGD